MFIQLYPALVVISNTTILNILHLNPSLVVTWMKIPHKYSLPLNESGHYNCLNPVHAKVILKTLPGAKKCIIKLMPAKSFTKIPLLYFSTMM